MDVKTAECKGYHAAHTKEGVYTADSSNTTEVHALSTKSENACTPKETCNSANCKANREIVNTSKIANVVAK